MELIEPNEIQDFYQSYLNGKFLNELPFTIQVEPIWKTFDKRIKSGLASNHRIMCKYRVYYQNGDCQIALPDMEIHIDITEGFSIGAPGAIDVWTTYLPGSNLVYNDNLPHVVWNDAWVYRRTKALIQKLITTVRNRLMLAIPKYILYQRTMEGEELCQTSQFMHTP